MKISNSQLVDWQATPALLEWFQIRFPVEAAKYQDVLDALAEDDLPDEAHWLMDKAGPDDCGCLHVFTPNVKKHVFAAGKLSVSFSLSTTGWIRAGLSIEADKSLNGDLGIITGGSIRVGDSLRTGGEIRAGGRIDVGRSITAGEGISSAHAIVSGGDIRSGKGIDAGRDYDSMMNALEELPDQSDESKKHLHILQKLWASFGGTQDYWDVVVSERGPFGLEAAGDILAVTNINSAQAIRAGDSILTDGDIQAGRCIYAGGNAVAGRSINAGWGVDVAGMLKAGADIDTSSIDAKGGIEAGGDILFSCSLKSDRQIWVTGNIRASDESIFATIQSSWELCAGEDIWCTGTISAVKIEVGGNLFSCRDIRAKGDIIAGKALESMRCITSQSGNVRAGLGIKAGEGIQAAQSIQAGQEIVAGDDWGIFAATGLKLADWKEHGQVIANNQPENLISGYWDKSADQEEMLRLESTSESEISERLGCLEGLDYLLNIKVIGLGNTGSHAIDDMIHDGVCGLEFAVADSVSLSLDHSVAERTVPLSQASPLDSGRNKAEQELDQKNRVLIGEWLHDAHMIFTIASAGEASEIDSSTIVAEIARKLGIFTVAIVTTPYSLENMPFTVDGAGINELQKHADSLIVIGNETPSDTLGSRPAVDSAFNDTQKVIHRLVGGITEIINVPSFVNPDFKDVRRVMASGGIGTVGTAVATGVDRARVAAEQAVASHLLEGRLAKAQGIVVIVTAIRGLTMAEVNQAINTVREYAADDAHIVFGSTYDDSMGTDIRVTVVAVAVPKH